MEEIDKNLKPYLSSDGSGFDLARADKKLPEVKALIEERNRLQDQINDALRLPSGKLATATDTAELEADAVASEVLSRLSVPKGRERFEAEARRVIDRNPEADIFSRANIYAAIDRVRMAMRNCEAIGTPANGI